MSKMIMLKGDKLPKKLKAAHPPVKQLYAVGKVDDLFLKPSVAIVGSRKVSPYGRYVTQKLASGLSKYDVVVISGLALGVDAIAHKSSIDSGGKTLAVMPCGLDNIYPRTNHRLAQEIIDSGGALISEYGEGEVVQKHNFIARNRIVAGLADVLLITEAALKSGTLHTARFALEQGKTVMAVPGNINSSGSEGTNNLIKSGALVASEVNDILFALGLEETDIKNTELIANNEQEKVILDLLSSGISDGDDLLSSSELEPSVFNQSLSMMEITGTVKALGNNQWGIS